MEQFRCNIAALLQRRHAGAEQHDVTVTSPSSADLVRGATGVPGTTGAATPSPGNSAPGAALELRGVHKRFGMKPALADLSLAVPPGTITVLLGPNGAGKTTAIRTITGALEPDAGTVRTFGLDPAVDGEEVRRQCGVVSAKPALYDRLTGYDNLLYAAELYGLGRNCRAHIVEAARRFGIDGALDQQVGGYSTGMKTRLALSRSVLHRPRLLLFDEPTSGLDPESSAAVLALIREMTADGSTVVMCTHHLVEAEGLADQVVMLEDGTDLVSGTPAELAQRYWPAALLRLGVEDPRHLDLVPRQPGVLRVERMPGGLGVHLTSFDVVPDLVDALVHAGARLTRVEPHVPTLEDLYFAVRKERAASRAAAPPPPAGAPATPSTTREEIAR
jgi:ABC-type multidrug transport system ATPase subunit